MMPSSVSIFPQHTYIFIRTRVVTEQSITKTTKATCCEQQGLSFDRVSGCNLLRLQLAFEPALFSRNLTSNLGGALLDIGTPAGDRVATGSQVEESEEQERRREMVAVLEAAEKMRLSDGEIWGSMTTLSSPDSRRQKRLT